LASLSCCLDPIWVPWPDFFYLSDDCGFLYMGHPLWREDGSVIYCTIASGPCQSSHLGSKSRRTHGHMLLSHLRLPEPGGPGPRIHIPHEQGGPVIPPGTGFLFVASYDSQGYGGGILTRLDTGPEEIAGLWLDSWTVRRTNWINRTGGLIREQTCTSVCFSKRQNVPHVRAWQYTNQVSMCGHCVVQQVVQECNEWKFNDREGVTVDAFRSWIPFMVQHVTFGTLSIPQLRYCTQSNRGWQRHCRRLFLRYWYSGHSYVKTNMTEYFKLTREVQCKLSVLFGRGCMQFFLKTKCNITLIIYK
jgi:hypothetical protein